MGNFKKLWDNIFNRKAVKLAKEKELQRLADNRHREREKQPEQYEADMLEKEQVFKEYFDLGDKFNFLGSEYVVMEFIRGKDRSSLNNDHLYARTKYRKQTGELESFYWSTRLLLVILKANPDIKPKEQP